MAVPGLTTTIKSGQPYFRITSLAYKTTNPADAAKVVNGQGAVMNSSGARYNYPGAVTVYLTEDIPTCLAEKMFYFHRETIRGIDLSHLTGVTPFPFNKFALWEIRFKQDIKDVFDMTITHAHTYFNIFPSLSINPSQDYQHLKQKRAEIQASRYRGIRVPSSRSMSGGDMVVLFEDQSSNVDRITGYEVEFQLITKSGTDFNNHASDILDFTCGNVRILPAAPGSLIFFGGPPPLPSGGSIYQNWQKVNFNH